MKINKLSLYAVNQSKFNNQNPAPTQTETNSTNTENTKFMPAIAPNYMAKINFKGKLDWDEIALHTKLMGKRIYSKRNVQAMSEIHDEAKGITAGRGLPTDWTNRIKDIDKFDKDSFILDFGKCFSKERDFADVDRLQNELSDLFKKHGIIDEDTPFSVKYIGHGFQAWAYKIQIGDDENSGIVTKLFKRDNNYLQNHGNYTEQNLAEYVKKYAGDESEFTKYWFGDTKNGIMVVDYVSPTQRPTKTLDLSDIGIGYGDDFPKNRINGIICDYGGIETMSNLMGNKTAQDIHKMIKYADSTEERVKLVNQILSENDGSDEFKDKAVGLVHSIKYLPEEIQPELFKKCHAIGSNRVNIALVQTIKFSQKFEELEPMINDLVLNTDDQKVLETIAKEIKSIPDLPRHKFFEKHSDTNISAIIKYLARNMNTYYTLRPKEDLESQNFENIDELPLIKGKIDGRHLRTRIFDKFIENSDSYAAISLINKGMEYMSKKRYDEYFEKFYAKNDPIINITLARSIDSLNSEESNNPIQRKWIDKLLECKDVRVTAGLSEVVGKIDKSSRIYLFEKLLPTKDKVSKEFLAESITSMPYYYYADNYKPWLTQLLDRADNMVRGSLANTIKGMKDENLKKAWTKIVLDGADETIKKMLEE